MPLPTPTRAALKKADAWVADARRKSGVSKEEREAISAALTTALAGGLAELGIQALHLDGQPAIALEANRSPGGPEEEARWAAHLASGGGLAVINVEASRGWWADGVVRAAMAQQPLDALVDVALVRERAPSAVLYHPTDQPAWGDQIFPGGVQVWVANPSELPGLWAAAHQWVRPGWHAQLQKTDPSMNVLQDSAMFTLFQARAPDLGARIDRQRACLAALEHGAEEGYGDSAEVTALRRAIGALAGLEGHPAMGPSATRAIADLTPALAHGLEGKDRLKQLQKAWEDADLAVITSFPQVQVRWKDLTPAVPEV